MEAGEVVLVKVGVGRAWVVGVAEMGDLMAQQVPLEVGVGVAWREGLVGVEEVEVGEGEGKETLDPDRGES